MPQEDERPEEAPLSASDAAGAAGPGEITPFPVGDEARRRIRARASPEGIVTILFTDVVESTRLRQRLGDDAAQELFREHNRRVREQIEKHGGFEVKTYGDGFMVAFSDVVAAVTCAIDVQRAIAQYNRERPGHRLQVRIGLNCGQTIKEEEDFFGSAVVIAARLADLARGGQILASEVVRGLTGSRQDVRYVHHGRHRLKGLSGTYDVWSVPWQEVQLGRFAGLWASRASRVAALVVLLTAGIGGVVAGLFLALAGGDGVGVQPAAAVREVAFHIAGQSSARRVSGDCVSEDIVYEGTFEGELTGEILGRQSSTFESFVYAATLCRSGLANATATITDTQGNTLTYLSESPISIARFQLQGTSAVSSTSVDTITGGTGIYEGASGRGSCITLAVNQIELSGSVNTESDSDCKFELVTGGAATTAAEPLIIQLGASPAEVTVFGGSEDVPSAVAIVVVYRNARDEAQKGLSCKLPVPDATQILAASKNDKQPVPAGERVWKLPDLPPGAIQRFEFTVELLAAETPTVPLVVEIAGEGFQRPVRSEPATIKVVQ